LFASVSPEAVDGESDGGADEGGVERGGDDGACDTAAALGRGHFYVEKEKEAGGHGE